VSRGKVDKTLSLVEIEQKLQPSLSKLQRLEKILDSKKSPEKLLDEVQDIATV
jgi:hypothetical protein